MLVPVTRSTSTAHPPCPKPKQTYLRDSHPLPCTIRPLYLPLAPFLYVTTNPFEVVQISLFLGCLAWPSSPAGCGPARLVFGSLPTPSSLTPPRFTTRETKVVARTPIPSSFHASALGMPSPLVGVVGLVGATSLAGRLAGKSPSASILLWWLALAIVFAIGTSLFLGSYRLPGCDWAGCLLPNAQSISVHKERKSRDRQ